MRNSIVQTLAVPAIGAVDAQGKPSEPSRLIQAGDVPMRVVVRNTGGTVVFIAHDVGDLAQINSIGSAYQLPPGQADVFVLAPKQSIMAASQGGGGQCAVAASEAFPVNDWMTS